MEHMEHGGHESAKHAGWSLDKKKAAGALGLGTLGANFGLVLAAGVAFPPYILASATLMAAYGLYDPNAGGKKKAAHGHH